MLELYPALLEKMKSLHNNDVGHFLSDVLQVECILTKRSQAHVTKYSSNAQRVGWSFCVKGSRFVC